MAKKEKPEIEDPTAPFWMATYGDMVTLLLTFFILLVSYSTIQLEKFKGAMESLRGALGVFEGHESVMKEPFIDFNSAEKTQGKPEKQEKIEKTIQDIKNMLNGSKLEDLLEVETLGDGVLFRLGDNLLFEPGRAELKPMALDVLHLIADLVRDSYTNVSVEGHTDNVPIHTRRFPSNWELSSARALSVVKYLYETEHIPPQILSSVGHGEHRPLVPNNTAENRAKNRRVEILVNW